MFLELALVLPIYLFIWYVLIRYKHLTKAMSLLDSLTKLTDEGFDEKIPEEEKGVCKKHETLKDAIQYENHICYMGKKVNGVLLK